MARDKLQGIIIEIGGETQGLDQALDNVNKKSKILENELKQVEKLLKLDPKNTDLLAQKQKLLGEAAGGTKDKLISLKDAQIKVEKAFKANDEWEKQYTPIKKEIESTKDRLKDLSKEQSKLAKQLESGKISTEQYDKFNKTIKDTQDELKALKQKKQDLDATFKDGHIDAKQFREYQREVAQTEQDLKRLENQSSKTVKRLNKISLVSGAVGTSATNTGKALTPLSLAIAGTGTASITMANQFEDSFAKVLTIADAKKVPIEALRKQILDLSDLTGIDANLVAEDAYNAISAGVDTAKAVGFVGKSSKLAKAGFAESAQSLDILTTILNAYGLEAEKTTDISDMLIQVQNKGKTTVGELSANMGKVIPTAKGQNVALEQLGASYAIMTSKGIKTAETTTYLNSMINELGKSGTKSSDILKKETGKSFSELMASGMSLADVLKIVNDDAKQNGLSMGDMFGSAEASKAALTLLGEGVKGFNDSVKDMQNSTGATDKAFEKLQTPAEEFRISLNNIKNSAIKMGDVLAPVFTKVSELVSKLATHFAGLDKNTLGIIATIAGIIAVVAPVLLIAGKIASTISAVTGAMAMLKTATMAQTIAQYGLNTALLASPITWIVVGVMAIVTAFILLWTKCEGFRNFFIAMWQGIVNIFKGVIDFIANNWQALLLMLVNPFVGGFKLLYDNCEGFRTFIDNLWANIKTIFTGFTEWIGAIFATDWTTKIGFLGAPLNAFFKNVSDMWGHIKGIFTSIIDFVVNVFTGNWEGAWTAVKDIFSNIFGLLYDIAKAPINGIIGLLNMAIGGINMLISGLNSISFEMPDWVPLIGGKSFGISIPSIPTIPMLANGGVMTQGSAIVGEAGAEMISIMNGKTYVRPLTADEKARPIETKSKSKGDVTVNVYSPKALTEAESARQFKKAQRELALGF